MTSLEGKTVLVTRAPEDASSWAARIEQLGGRCIEWPCIRTVFKDDEESRAQLLQMLSSCDWLLLTSRKAVLAVHQLLAPETTPPHYPAIAAVGPATAKEAARLLAEPELTATGTGARELAELVAARIKPNRSLRAGVVASDLASRDVEEVLEPLGAEVQRLSLYRTVPRAPEDGDLDLREAQVDAILIASPSAVRGLLQSTRHSEGIPVVTLGATTSEAARNAGLTVVAEAPRPNLSSLLGAIP